MGAHKGQDTARHRFDVADAAPLLLDAHGTVTGWTRDAERLLDYTASETVGRSVAALLVPEDARRLPEITARCRADGSWAGLLTALHKHGRPVRVMARITVADDPGAADGSARWLVLLSELAEAPGWDLSRRVLEQMVSRSPIGIAIVDTDLRCVWSNPALEQFGSAPAQRRLGLRFAEIQPGLDAEDIEAQMRRVLETGEPIVEYEHVGRVRSAPHRETAHTMSFTRIDDDRGHPVGVYYTVVDITERHRARQRLALLDRAGEYIGRSLDIRSTAQELADVAVPALADYITVDLLESVLRGAEPTTRVPLVRAGQQSVNQGVPEAVVEVGEVAAYLPGTPPLRCLAEGTSWREERLDPLAAEWATGIPGGRQATFLELGLHSVMVVPIRARGVTLGVTTFFRRRRQEPFDEDDLNLAEDLVSRAAVCVDNARRYTRERDAALVLQRSLLPHRLPEQDAVEVAACYRPADELTGLGGDWYDLIPLSGARVALVVGEVPGHGIGAAAAMGRLRTAVRTLAALDLPPEEVLGHLDDLVARAAREEGVGPGTEDTDSAQGSGCVYVVYDPVDGQCTMAAAGHPAPAVILTDGTVAFVDLPQGPSLGVGGPPFESVELALAAGSTLALHTDGLLARGEEWAVDTGRDRLRLALERHAPSLDLRCRAVVDALAPARPHDDVALLMARTRLLGPDQVADWDVPVDPARVAEARKTASRQLTEWGLEEFAFTTELVVSELVTNAIRHAVGPIRLRLIRERSLVCEVFDSGDTAPHLRHPRTTDEGGRGLLLVSQFAQRWGTRFVPEGKIIWAEQSLEDPPD
ncbi:MULTISPECIES: SpoIIE family protein phosphatase [unclassified Streptomyces]|uniref:SpoIIE family protein phosphatase n=1 Tax=unclassified Streptomyces TaxID=2593676 RepID=UPI0024731FB3|nr:MULTISPECIES: SpoIIE family protein phosphatase [unclassified Streptomyces]MDH6448290.1 PAS domain S-box-containing protein [Streptomyces sp. SAI-119]MDH6501128.1 PAS domain S-box-containing protein [Streptomyces sp. SAI-149]